MMHSDTSHIDLKFKNTLPEMETTYVFRPHTIVYIILSVRITRGVFRRKLYSNSIEQLPIITRLCTVAKLVLCRTIAKYLLY